MGTKQAENVEWKLGIQIDEYRFLEAMAYS